MFGQKTSQQIKRGVTPEDLAKKQDKLTAGENITIEGNIISAAGGGEEIKTYSAVINFPYENQLVGTLVWNDETPTEDSFLLNYEFQGAGVTIATLKNYVTKHKITMEGSTTDIYSFVATFNGVDYLLFTLAPVSGASNWTVSAQTIGGNKVSSLGGATGDITLGDGLSIADNQLKANGGKLYMHTLTFCEINNKGYGYIFNCYLPTATALDSFKKVRAKLLTHGDSFLGVASNKNIGIDGTKFVNIYVNGSTQAIVYGIKLGADNAITTFMETMKYIWDDVTEL